MDIATIIGILFGIVLLIGAILAEGSLLPFWSFSSIMIVLGGTIAATLINYSLSQVIGTLKVLKIAFVDNVSQSADVIKNLVKFAEKARREGLLALEAEAENLEEPFLKKGIQLIVDGTDPELVRKILETELSFIEDRHRQGAEMFQNMGASAPAFGMIGTLIGLILMLRNLDDPSTIGPGMAVALITTFYGTLLANLIFLPIAGKLKIKSNEEILNKELMLEGILSIQAGENPRIVSEKMMAFLNPNERLKLQEQVKRDDGED